MAGAWTYCARIGGWSEREREREQREGGGARLVRGRQRSRSRLERRGAPGRVWLARGSRCWAEPVQGLSRDRGAHRGTCVGPATGSVSEDVGRAPGGRAARLATFLPMRVGPATSRQGRGETDGSSWVQPPVPGAPAPGVLRCEAYMIQHLRRLRNCGYRCRSRLDRGAAGMRRVVSCWSGWNRS
jgi:hypothetical protein